MAFAALGLTPDASSNDIRRAYKSLALLHHPDKHTGDPDRFQGISNAFSECMRSAQDSSHVDTSVPVVTIIRVTLKEMLQGGAREVHLQALQRPCRTCRGTGARMPSDFITCLGCGGVGRTTLGTCVSCGGEGGCNVSLHGTRCLTCNGRTSNTSDETRGERCVNVTIPPGACDGSKLDCLEAGPEHQMMVSHQDLSMPVSLSGSPGCTVLMTSPEELTLNVTITLGEMLCGFYRSILLFGEPVELRQSLYNPAIARPGHVFKAVRNKAGLLVNVHILVGYPAPHEVAPFLQLLSRMFN